MPLNNPDHLAIKYKGAIGNVSSFQISSIPFLSSSIIVQSGTSPIFIQFPSISKNLTVKNTVSTASASAPLKFGFSSNGVVSGTSCIYLNNGESFSGDFRLTGIYLQASGSTCYASVAAGLTTVDVRELLYNWSDSNPPIVSSSPPPPPPEEPATYLILDSGSWSSDAKLGSSSLFFSGSDAEPHRVSLGLNVPGVTGSGFTISMWIKPYQLSVYDMLISKWDENYTSGAVNIGRSWGFLIANSVLRGDSSPNGNSIMTVTGNTTVTTGSWQHVVFSYDAIYNNLYYNGAIDGTRNRPADGIYNSPAETFIGYSPRWGGAVARYFSGTIDEVAIWNIPLSASQIASLYNSGSGIDATTISSGNLVAYYTMEHDNGVSTGPGFDSLKNQVAPTPTGTLLSMNTGTYTFV